MESDGTIAVQMHGKSNNAVTANIDKFTVGTAGVTAVAFGGTSTVSNRDLCASFASTERMILLEVVCSYNPNTILVSI